MAIGIRAPATDAAHESGSRTVAGIIADSMVPDMKRGCRAPRGDPTTSFAWSAAGELQPGRPWASHHPTAPLTGGGYLPARGRDVSGEPPERTEPTPLLNHETSDHLLSLVDCQRDPIEPHQPCGKLCSPLQEHSGISCGNPRSPARSPPRRAARAVAFPLFPRRSARG